MEVNPANELFLFDLHSVKRHLPIKAGFMGVMVSHPARIIDVENFLTPQMRDNPDKEGGGLARTAFGIPAQARLCSIMAEWRAV